MPTDWTTRHRLFSVELFWLSGFQQKENLANHSAPNIEPNSESSFQYLSITPTESLIVIVFPGYAGLFYGLSTRFHEIYSSHLYRLNSRMKTFQISHLAAYQSNTHAQPLHFSVFFFSSKHTDLRLITRAVKKKSVPCCIPKHCFGVLCACWIWTSTRFL